jgi:hypothetical protein
MYRIDNLAAGTLPTPSAPGTPGFFTTGNQPLGIPSTIVTQDWANSIQEEIMSVLNQAGVTPIKSSFVQLVAAIRACNILADVSPSVNVLIANPSPAYPSLLPGTQAVLIPNLTNTGPSTLTVSSLGALAFLRPDATVLQPGDAPAGRRLPIIYDGSAWRLINWPTRVRLAQNLTLYCNAQTGSDNNNGLTLGTAFQTLNGVYNYIYQNIDATGYTITVNCAGNYPQGLLAQNIIVGLTAPNGLVFNFTGGATIAVTNGVALEAINPGVGFNVTGAVTVSATGSSPNGFGLAVANGAQCFYQGMTFGACTTAQINVAGFGICGYSGSYTIAGNSPAHWNVSAGGQILGLNPATITLVGTPVFSTAFAAAVQSGSQISLSGAPTFAGTGATGTRYSAAGGGSINTFGAGTTFLPGSLTGSIGSGTWTGFYN